MLMMATTTTNDFFGEPVWGFLTKRMTVTKEEKDRTHATVFARRRCAQQI